MSTNSSFLRSFRICRLCLLPQPISDISTDRVCAQCRDSGDTAQPDPSPAPSPPESVGQPTEIPAEPPRRTRSERRERVTPNPFAASASFDAALLVDAVRGSR